MAMSHRRRGGAPSPRRADGPGGGAGRSRPGGRQGRTPRPPPRAAPAARSPPRPRGAGRGSGARLKAPMCDERERAAAREALPKITTISMLHSTSSCARTCVRRALHEQWTIYRTCAAEITSLRHPRYTASFRRHDLGRRRRAQHRTRRRGRRPSPQCDDLCDDLCNRGGASDGGTHP